MHQNKKGEIDIMVGDEKNNIEEDFLTEKEARIIKKMFKKYLKLYSKKDSSTSDKEWLEKLFNTEIPEVKPEKAEDDAQEIVDSIKNFDECFADCNDAAKRGISKESWLADKLQEAAVGMPVNEYGKFLQRTENFLKLKNAELESYIFRKSDNGINMNPNLDGNMAEHMIAETANMSAFLKEKNISIEVLESYATDSVDVRAVNYDTGNYQNYQLKFGKDAKSTIELLKRGNYNNQRIIVPSEQLEEVQAYFKQKGSSKTITDHIEAWGVKGKSFTKEDMKKLQIKAQNQGVAPELDYSYYQTRDLAASIGKNAVAMGLQSAAITTGFDIAKKIFDGENIEPDKLVEVAIKTGVDTSVKVVTVGVLQIAVKKGIIKFIPKETPSGIIVNIVCMGVENVKILNKIASGEISVTQGLDQMGRITTSMACGYTCGRIGNKIGIEISDKIINKLIVKWLKFPKLIGFVGGIIGYCAGSELGNVIYDTAKKVASAAKTVAKSVWNGIKSIGEKVGSTLSTIGQGVLSLFGF